jgi:5-methyltetrahydrofolate--homocysteine methyltransferase
LKGKYPKILEDPVVGAAARELYENGQQLLRQIVTSKSLTANAVYGFWPAASDGDDIVVVADGRRGDEVARLPMLRQQWERRGQDSFRCLADYVAPLHSGREDYMGAFVLTAGIGLDGICARCESALDDYSSIMAKALADRLAEAFAELLHERVRKEWGYGAGEHLTKGDLIQEQYRGIRPAPGYPACPDHTTKQTLFAMLDAECSAGVRLTETFAMLPAASVSGLYLAHPEARYFAVDRITKDQVEDYARRRGFSLREAEKWLAPNLAYEPE